MPVEILDPRIASISRRYGLRPTSNFAEGAKWEEVARWRELAKNDLFFLSTVILGCSRFGVEPMGGPFADQQMSCHEELCSVINGDWEGKDRLLVIVPRDHFKSTTIRNFCIQRILRNPNVSILLLGATLKNQALRSITSIKQQFESNRILRMLFPDIRPMKGRWSGNAITVTRPYHGDESTIEVTAVGLEPEGGHYDIIVPDDIVTDVNSDNRDRQEKVIAWMSAIEPMLNLGGIMLGAGTRYADYDWYGFIQREASDLWKFHVRSQLFDDEGNMTTDTGESHILFPEEWDRQRIRDKQAAMGIMRWCCQYGNDPVPSGLAEIKSEWIEQSIIPMPEGHKITCYGGFDPRGSGICEAAWAVVGVDKDNIIWVQDVQGGLWGNLETRKQFLDMLKAYTPTHSVLEAIGVGDPLEELILQDMQEAGMVFSVEFVRSWEKSIEEMTRTVLTPLLETGRMKLAPHLKGTPLIEQMLRFPKAVRKDRLAALTMATWTALQYGYDGSGEVPGQAVKNEEVDWKSRRHLGYDDDSGVARVDTRGKYIFA